MKLSKEQYNKLPKNLHKHFKQMEVGVGRNTHPT
jgi:hypothetical protein